MNNDTIQSNVTQFIMKNSLTSGRSADIVSIQYRHPVIMKRTLLSAPILEFFSLISPVCRELVSEPVGLVWFVQSLYISFHSCKIHIQYCQFGTFLVTYTLELAISNFLVRLIGNNILYLTINLQNIIVHPVYSNDLGSF